MQLQSRAFASSSIPASLERRVLLTGPVKLKYELSRAPGSSKKRNKNDDNVLLLMHGLGGDLAAMHKLMKALRTYPSLDSYTFASLSLPAHNGSDDVAHDLLPWTPVQLVDAFSSLLCDDLGMVSREATSTISDENSNDSNNSHQVVGIGVAFSGYAFLHAMRHGWSGNPHAESLPPLRRFASVDWTTRVGPGLMEDPPPAENEEVNEDLRRTKEAKLAGFRQGAVTPALKEYVDTVVRGYPLSVFQRSLAFAHAGWKSQGQPIDALTETLRTVPDAQVLMLHNQFSTEAQEALGNANLPTAQFREAMIPSTSFALSQENAVETAAIFEKWMRDTN